MNNLINNLINITLNSRVGRIVWVVVTFAVVMTCLYLTADLIANP